MKERAAAYRQVTGDRKDVADWLRQKRTQEMMTHLTSVTGIPVTELYQVNQGGLPDRQGTWLHPKLSVRFAMWLSDDFGLLVENKVEEWVRGCVPARPPKRLAVGVVTSGNRLNNAIEVVKLGVVFK